MQSIDKAKLCLKTIKERKAIEPVLLHVENLTSVTDYFLITSGNSTRQVQAIARHLQKTLWESGFRPYGTEGKQEGHWVLMDYGDVVIHIFYQPLRELYDLEGLWIEAPEVETDDQVLEDVGP
ncbi:MAG: ribosome silencing factor [Desulfobacteraceae bacterium]|nr:ribosome silencing factor [Desulfobacterales bacterium]MBL6967412.1 ribosome silencing factor [Desulfobacteraceae bacterium]MBL7101444.1 ribosome silencing factor [Desulfobacteraceae bacterium]MBL7171775.1 ribosome silencing factor [Desulfobacteraceae bacterium]